MTSRSDCVQYTGGTNTPYEGKGSGTNYVTQKEMSHAKGDESRTSSFGQKKV